MFRRVTASGVLLRPCSVLAFFICSILKHPHDFVAPDINEADLTMVSAPQEHRQFHWGLPCFVFFAREVMTSLAKVLPVRSMRLDMTSSEDVFRMNGVPPRSEAGGSVMSLDTGAL